MAAAPGDSSTPRVPPAGLLAALLSLAVYGIAQGGALLNPYVVNDDVRQQLFWMQRWRDPALFPPDLLNEYARLYVPVYVRALYRAAAVAVDPLTFSKALTAFLFGVLGGLLWGTGRRLGGRSVGWAFVSVYWLMPFFLDTVSGGLARSFAFPLLVLFTLGWVERRPWAVITALLLQAALIPYVFLLCMAATAISWALFLAGRLAVPAVPLAPGGLVAGAAGIVMAFVTRLPFDLRGFGPLVSRAEMAGNPLFTSAGRYAIPLFPAPLQDLVITPWEWIGGFHELGTVGGSISTVAVVLLALVGLRHVDWRSLRPFLPPVAILAAASLVLYLAAYAVLLKLFVPDRYVLYTVNLFYCGLLALALHALWTRYGRNRVAGLCLVAVALVLGTVRLRGVGVRDYSADQPLYRALQLLSPGTRVAAHPYLADNVLTFGRRNVVVSFELAHPWSRGYWREIEPRLTDFFDAYYATHPAPLTAFCKKYAVDLLVVDDRHFDPAFIAGNPCFAPYDAQIRALAGRGDRCILAPSNGFDGVRVGLYYRMYDTRDCFVTPAPRSLDSPEPEPIP